MRFQTIKAKLIFYLTITLLPIFAILVYIGELNMKDTLYNDALSKANMLAYKAARDIEKITFSTSSKPKEIANFVSQRIISIDEVKRLMIEDVKNSKFIYGMALAFIPGYFKGKRYYCQYYYAKGGRILEKQLIPPLYRYTESDWFKKPIELKRNMWSKPYFDKGGGGVWMSTYSALIKDGSGKIIGIATADISIGFLSKIVDKIKVLKTGGAFLFTKNGDLLTNLNKETRNSVSQIIKLYNKQRLKSLAQDILNNEKKYLEISNLNEHFLLLGLPIRGTDWILGVVFPKNELFLKAKKYKLYSLLIIASGLFVVVFIILLISKNITKDISKIKEISLKIAKGNFNVDIPSSFNDESQTIAEALDVMQKSLKKYIEEVKDKARIENELELARKIQNAFVPNELNTELDGFKVSGFSMWARQVGGDFYGAGRLNDGKILFYLGDVSGKSIPAVLYVAMIKSIIYVLSKQSSSVKDMVNFLNNYLASITKQNHFATIFIGLIDEQNGKLEFCNAGHEPPIAIKGNAIFTPLLDKNLPVGVFENFDFKTRKIRLDSFDTLLIFSDGVLDATNDKDEQFGYDRLNKLILENLGSKLNLSEIIKNKLLSFTNKKELYDDITVLSLCKVFKT